MLEDRRAVQSDARRAEQGELDRLHIAFLAARRVGGRAVDRADFAVGKGFGIKGRGLLGIAFVPEAEGKRSEEHTSELQSLMRISYAVFCLKKKKKHTNITH